MKFNPQIHQRHSTRLKSYDYSSAGGYFVTICAYQKEHLFGNIINGQMVSSAIGEIPEKYWLEIPEHFRNVSLDEFVIMPNHIHGILFITNNMDGESVSGTVGTDYNLSLQKSLKSHNPKQSKFQNVIPKSLSYIIATFKAAVTRNTHKTNNPFAWQSRFYDHIIRSEGELKRIRQYIINNPLKWEFDRENQLSRNYKISYNKYYRGIYDS